jgi:predicted TIM-barrel fold metal-dependent hydrolase
MKQGQPIFDADAHVQEPSTIWSDYLDPGLRDQVVTGADAVLRVGGQPTIDTWRSDHLTEEHRRRMRPLDMVEKYGDLARRHFEPAAIIEGLDAEGTDVAALFPSFGLYVPWGDHLAPELATGLARAYHRWIADFCSHDPRRLVPIGVTPLHDPQLAADEARRAVDEHGIKAFMLRPNPVQGRPIADPRHEGFFSTIEDTGVPLIIHEGTGARVVAAGADRFDTWCGRHVASHPLEQMLALASLVFEGVLERHPRLKVGFFESGSGWLPYWLHRMDEHHEQWGHGDYPELTLEPSEYFARQCVISTESDDALARVTVETVGADHVVWASDFPHPESLWPNAVDSFIADAGLSAGDERQVLWETPCDLYGLGG